MNRSQSWPEPVVRVQSLAQSGISTVPERYIKPPSLRPIYYSQSDENYTNIPIIDLQNLVSDDQTLQISTMKSVMLACRDYGFFQIVNHGVSHELMKEMRQTWREFFDLPLETKEQYSNSPITYEGYGSRLGVEKGAILDWSDYYFLHYLPFSLRNSANWPALPPSCRKVTAEYGEEVVKLGGKLLKILSINLGLKENHLQNAFGGENIGACLRVNFYSKCPQPDLTLGLSPHSDPGGITLLLPDDDVAGLQVRKGGDWVTVKPFPDAFIVNIGDQVQVLSNDIYKSAEHRVVVNSAKDRISLAFFYNPKSDLPIEPIKELVSEERPALYSPMTFDEYRLYVRTKGLHGKAQVESLKSPT